MAIQGSLEAFSLLEILDFAVRKQGWLETRGPSGHARFALGDGVVAARCECSWMPEQTPLEQVVFDVLMQRHGQFIFECAPVPDGPVVTPTALLRAVDALALEWEHHTQIAPSHTSVVHLDRHPVRSELVVDRARWQLVAHLLEGPRTVMQLALRMGLSELMLRRLLSDAFIAGLVTVDGRQPDPATDPTAPFVVAVSLEAPPTQSVPQTATIDIAQPA
jgi:hypothetical protein